MGENSLQLPTEMRMSNHRELKQSSVSRFAANKLMKTLSRVWPRQNLRHPQKSLSPSLHSANEKKKKKTRRTGAGQDTKYTTKDPLLLTDSPSFSLILPLVCLRLLVELMPLAIVEGVEAVEAVEATRIHSAYSSSAMKRAFGVRARPEDRRVETNIASVFVCSVVGRIRPPACIHTMAGKTDDQRGSFSIQNTHRILNVISHSNGRSSSTHREFNECVKRHGDMDTLSAMDGRVCVCCALY